MIMINGDMLIITIMMIIIINDNGYNSNDTNNRNDNNNNSNDNNDNSNDNNNNSNGVRNDDDHNILSSPVLSLISGNRRNYCRCS